MENYNYHRTGKNYYLEDKRKSVKKKNQCFVSFGINRSKHSSRLHFSKLCKKVTERLSRFRHRSVVSKITRETDEMHRQNTNVIALLAIHKSDFVRQDGKRIYFFEIKPTSSLRGFHERRRETWSTSESSQHDSKFRIAIFRFFCETCAPKSWTLNRWKSN